MAGMRLVFAFFLSLLLTANCKAVSPGNAPLSQSAGPTHFLSLPEGKIAYDDTGGHGPLVVAIPGMGDLRAEYRYLVPLLVRAGYRVVTVDIRGMGESGAKWNDYSARAVAGDVLALLKDLRVDSAAIVGTSFAAGCGLWIANSAPDKVKSIVMISPIVKDYPQPFYVEAAMKLGFAGPWRVSFWMAYWESLFPLHKPADHEAYSAALRSNLHEPGRMDALEAMVHLSKASTAQLIRTTPTPALLIMGTADKDFSDPAAEAKTIAAQIGAETMMVEGAGHYPQAESPDAVASRIVKFLRDHE